MNHKGTAVKGLHYFEPTKYEVMGINTFKLTGENVDGENGFIPSNTVLLTLPTLLKPLEQRHAAEEAVQKMVRKMVSAGGVADAQHVLKAITNHMSDKECDILNNKMSAIETAWVDNVFGGRVSGNARGFHNWVWRHVVEPGEKHLHPGGPMLFSKVLEFAENEDWQGLSDWKNNRRWKTIRMSETTPKNTKAMPVVVRLLPPPPAHIHKPIVGITTQPLYSDAILQHYQCPKLKDDSWLVKGGVLVTSVQPNSLYAKAGGLKDDIIYAFQNSSTHAEFSPAGTWYSELRDLPLSIIDLCNDTPINENVTMFVIRNSDEQRVLQLTFSMRQPKYDELPSVRQIYPYCNEGRLETKQKARVQGIVFTPLRANHISAFRLLDYMLPSKRFDFKVVIEGVSPESPAYATGAVHAGSIITKINDEKVADSWDGVLKQLANPHPKTNCWVLDTEYQGMSNKFVMVARTSQAK